MARPRSRLGLGLGTNYWGTFAKSLGQHEVVAFGLSLTLFAWLRPVPELTTRRLLVGAVGLALAVTARFQMAPLVAVLLFGLLMRVGFRRALVPAALVTASLAALFALQYHWFGHIFGAMPRLEALHPDVHGVSASISRTPWVGAAGMLISPNRGLFVFSPITLVIVWALTSDIGTRPGWALLATLVSSWPTRAIGLVGRSLARVLSVVVALTPQRGLDNVVRGRAWRHWP